METGVLQQYAPPLEMYNNPANLFVADFMGNPTMNFIDGRINQDGLVEFGGMKARFEAQAGEAAGNRNVVVGIRPEYIHIDEDGVKEATVYSTLPSGMETTVKLDVQGTSLTAVVFGDVDYPVDSKVKFAFHKAAVLFDKESGKNIARGRLTLE
jgi:multiple sugar transport system ATP-binding protein